MGGPGPWVDVWRHIRRDRGGGIRIGRGLSDDAQCGALDPIRRARALRDGNRAARPRQDRRTPCVDGPPVSVLTANVISGARQFTYLAAGLRTVQSRTGGSMRHHDD